MTPREKFKRIDAYARISKRVTDCFRILTDGLDRAAALQILRVRERHAWARLPENVRKWVQP